jgi:PAS domain S-box-containing protein
LVSNAAALGFVVFPVQMKILSWRSASGPAIHAPIRGRLILRLLAYAVVTAGVLAALLLYLREEALASGEAVLSAFAQLTEDQTTRIFAEVDLTLQAVDEKMAVAAGKGSASEDAIRAELAALLVNRPFLRGITVLDANGQTVYGSEVRLRGLDLSDRAFFANSKNEAGPRVMIGLPVRARTLDEWIIPVTRALRGPTGKFAGVIVAGVNPLFFDGVWTVPKSLREQATALWTDDGSLLMRSPFDERLMGASTFSRSLVAALKGRDSSEGTYRTTSLIDGRDRVVAYRRLTAYPTLVLSITQPADIVLRAWWRTVWLVVAGWAVAAAVVAGLATWLTREWNRHRATEDRYRMLFKASPYPTVALDSTTRNFLAVSDAAVEQYGWSREEMLAMNSNDLYPPEDLLKIKALRNRSQPGILGPLRGLRHRTKDGTIIDVEMILRPIDIDGRPGYLATAENVTERLRSERARREAEAAREASERARLGVEDQLRQAQKMESVGQLTGGIAHDFNNVLHVILANADALEEEDDLDVATRTERFGQLSQAVLRASNLTRQLLAFSRKQPLKPQRTDLNELVGDTGKMLRRALGAQIEIDSILARDLGSVDVDRSQFETVLVNLCINARDAMPVGGKLTIETGNAAFDDKYVSRNPDAIAGPHAMLAVTDTGSGMPPEVLAKVFEPFFTTKEAGKGTGLGLSMVYGFIKQSNGHIRIDSEVGRGTCIKLYLPQADGVAEIETLHDESPAPRGRERILVVEDEPEVRASVVQQLQSLGYSVAWASMGGDGILAFEGPSPPFDLLLTDVVMPGTSGKALAAEVAYRWPTTKIVFMSGFAELSSAQHGRLDEGALLLTKPFRKVELGRMVRLALDGEPAFAVSQIA